jgi:type VI secretion system protein ImpH
MRIAYRQRPVDLTRQLLAEPQSFEFQQATRVLTRALGRAGHVDAMSRIRYRNSLSLAYPVGDIESIRVLCDGNAIVGLDEALAALAEPNVEIEVTVAFLSLTGTFGSLPLSFTEEIAARETRRRHSAARAFLDILSDRPMQRFYAAWRYEHPVLGHEETGGSALGRVMCALAGHGLDSQRSGASQSQDGLSGESIASMCAALRHKPMSGPYLSRLLTACLGDSVRVEDFVGAWYELPDDLRGRLGGANVTLGADMLLGERSWQRHLRLRLHVGPLRRERYRAFLADGEAAMLLRRWIVATLGHAYEYEVVPLLHKDDVDTVCLGSVGQGGLGRDAFLMSVPSTTHRSDAKYLLSL